MTDKELVKFSKFMSKVLRHSPERIGVTLDKNGWLEISALIKGAKNKGKDISISDIEYIVANNDKKRFEFSEDKNKIRACQGHSIKIDLGLEPVIPPDVLYHGTAIKTVEYIKKDGINS